MVNIRDLLQERETQTFSDIANDSWVDSIIENKLNEKSVYLVVPLVFLFGKGSAVSKKKEILLQHFNIAAVYDVGTPFPNTYIPFVALELTKDKPKHVKIAAYDGKTLERGGDKTKNDSSGLSLGTTFTTEYNEYLNRLFVLDNIGRIQDDNKIPCECRLIPFDEYDLEHPEPGYYTEKMVELRKFFDREDLLRLKDVADVYSPSQDKEEGSLFSFANASYPYDYTSAKKGRRTNVLIKKGDILISKYSSTYYLFHDDLPQELYAPNSVFVVRPNQNLVSPEYLFLYLSCKTGKNVCLLDAVRRGSMLPRLNRESLAEFPVLKSKKSADFYAEHFKLLYLKGSKLGDYNAFLSEAEVSAVESTEDILNLELFENLTFYKKDVVLSLVKGDLKELDICYKAKAYKATLIMAGSILEAVLIDWLSEMYKEDFFLEISSHTKWKAMKEKKAKNYDYEPKLADYISEIKDLGYPSWMDNKTREKFGKRATHIREKRNLVHAKLCLRECEKLDDKLCREVIEYLREVVRIRFKLDK